MTHLVLSPPSRPTKAAPVDRLLAVVRSVWNGFQEARRFRSTVRTLHRLNDHALKDIGLERDNIEPVVRAKWRG